MSITLTLRCREFSPKLQAHLRPRIDRALKWLVVKVPDLRAPAIEDEEDAALIPGLETMFGGELQRILESSTLAIEDKDEIVKDLAARTIQAKLRGTQAPFGSAHRANRLRTAMEPALDHMRSGGGMRASMKPDQALMSELLSGSVKGVANMFGGTMREVGSLCPP